MTESMGTRMIYMTASTPDEARAISKTLISERLIACANVIDGVTSMYRWNDAVEIETESVVVMKTAEDTCQPALERITELHSYETPCAISYVINDGLPDYLAWLVSETRSQDRSV